MAVGIAFAHAAVSTDDEAGRIAGWRPDPLSPYGRSQALELGQRWRGGGLAAVFCSDLPRATETVEIAFAGFRIPIHRDTRLRDCDYGSLAGRSVTELVEHDRLRCADPFPGGQSYQQVVDQTRRFLRDLAAAWDGREIMIVAHRINRLALTHLLTGRRLAELIERDPVPVPTGPPRAVPGERGDRCGTGRAGTADASAGLDGTAGGPWAGWSYRLPTGWPDPCPPAGGGE